MRAWCPVNPNSLFEKGYGVIFGEEDNPSFSVDKEAGLFRSDYLYQVGKVAVDSPAGWIATVDGETGDVFVSRFMFEKGKPYPEDASVEVWHNGLGSIFAWGKYVPMAETLEENPYVFESEIISPYYELNPGESAVWNYQWAGANIGGDFPVIDCSAFGVISQKLTVQNNRITGRFGSFYEGGLEVVFFTETGKERSRVPLKTTVHPFDPIVLDEEIHVPERWANARLYIKNRGFLTD